MVRLCFEVTIIHLNCLPHLVSELPRCSRHFTSRPAIDFYDGLTGAQGSYSRLFYLLRYIHTNMEGAVI